MEKCNIEWTREKTLTLIEEYRKRRGLWDMTHEDYRKKDIKRELLDQVSQKLDAGIPAIEIEKKFHTLRTQYHREINRMQQIRGKEAYKSKWFAFKHLQFLSSKVACRASKSALKIKIECDTSSKEKDGSEEPPTKFLIKEVPLQQYKRVAVTPTPSIAAEFLTTPEKTSDEEIPTTCKDHSPSEAERKREIETFFEDTAKTVKEQEHPGKVIIKHINVPVRFRGSIEHKVVAATFENQEQQEIEEQQDIEEQQFLDTSSNNEQVEDVTNYQTQSKPYKTLQKRDLYEEVMHYEEEIPRKSYYENKPQSPQRRDEFDVYGEYIANEVRFITSRDILIQVKHKINTALFEASMAQLHKTLN